MKHKHYEVLTQWLADQTLSLQYADSAAANWYATNLIGVNPISHPDLNWRIKPRMVKVGRHEWPMPLEVAPEKGAYFYIASGNVSQSSWDDDATDHARLEIGILHLTKEAAQQHADALRCINRGDV